jgi:hypothetical protein
MMTVLRKVLEMALLFAGLLAIDHYNLAGIAFVELEPNPYWIPVVAMSLAYGSGMGLAATAIATVIWVFSTHHWPAHYDHLAIQLRLSILPLMWSVCALIIGEVTSSRQGRLKGLQQRCTELARDTDKIAKALTSLSKINRELQVRIATSHYVAGEALVAASGLLVPGQPDQRLALAKLISLAIESDDFTYYRVEGTRLVPLLSGTSPLDSRADASQVRWADAILAKPEIVHVEQQHGRTLLKGLGVAAVPVADPGTGSVVALLIIHSAPRMRFNPAKMTELRHLGQALLDYAEVFAKPALRLADGESSEGRVA